MNTLTATVNTEPVLKWARMKKGACKPSLSELPRDPEGTSQVLAGNFKLGFPHFRGEFILRQRIWDIAKCPEYRGVLISSVF